jgi:hypothetical protein
MSDICERLSKLENINNILLSHISKLENEKENDHKAIMNHCCTITEKTQKLSDEIKKLEHKIHSIPKQNSKNDELYKFILSTQAHRALHTPSILDSLIEAKVNFNTPEVTDEVVKLLVYCNMTITDDCIVMKLIHAGYEMTKNIYKHKCKSLNGNMRINSIYIELIEEAKLYQFKNKTYNLGDYKIPPLDTSFIVIKEVSIAFGIPIVWYLEHIKRLVNIGNFGTYKNIVLIMLKNYNIDSKILSTTCNWIDIPNSWTFIPKYFVKYVNSDTKKEFPNFYALCEYIMTLI